MGFGRIKALVSFELQKALRRRLETVTMLPERAQASAGDPEWQKVFRPFMESPAESAFLDAMIASHGFVPTNGELRSIGIFLQFQVKVGRYRFDFLANNWLVIEIDGAAYHSSPEAIARDAERDRYCESKGFSVLRIPAKVVFQTPDEAVARVSAALKKGRRIYEGEPLAVEMRQAAATAMKLAKNAKPAAIAAGTFASRLGTGFANAVAEINQSINEASERENGPKG